MAFVAVGAGLAAGGAAAAGAGAAVIGGAAVLGGLAGGQQARQTRRAERAQREAIEFQRQAARVERQAVRAQIAQADVANRRARIRAVAAARRERARIVAAGQAVGGVGTTPVAGAAAGIRTQAAANIGVQQQLAGLEARRVGALGRAAELTSFANIAKSRANIATGRAATFQALTRAAPQLGAFGGAAFDFFRTGTGAATGGVELRPGG